MRSAARTAAQASHLRCALPSKYPLCVRATRPKFDLASGNYQFQNGRNYGEGRDSLGYNPFEILRLSGERQLHEQVTIRICRLDKDGKLVCVPQ